MNKVILVGRITSKPELRYSTNNTAITKTNIAVNREYKNKNGEYVADFIPCVFYNKLAERVCEWVDKGDLVGIAGRYETSSYEKDGKKVYTSYVVVENVYFLSSKKKTENKQNNAKAEMNNLFEEFSNEVELKEEETELTLPF